MEKKTAEEIAIQMYCDRNNFHEVKDTPDGKRLIAKSEFIKGVLAGIEYSSLQSEEKDKEIERLREALKRIRNWAYMSNHEGYTIDMLFAEVEQALSNQPIESDKDNAHGNKH